MTAGNDVVDLSKWDGTGFSVNVGDAFSNDNDKVTVMASSLAGTNSNLKLTSIENLEIINAKETKALNLVGANFKGLESIELKGDATTLNVSGFTYGVKIDATENADNIFGGTKADTINGGAGNDIINAGSGNDVLTGGNGADTFIVGSVQSLGIDKILDFSAEDKISMNGFVPNELKKFDASTFSTVNYKTLDSVLATFGPGGANVTKAGDVVIFSYDGKTYALLAKGVGFKEANDALIDITGTNVASLTESNFGEASASGEGSGSGTSNFQLYSKFKEAVDAGTITEGQTATIQSMTNAEVKTLLKDASIDKYLAKIADGGIKAITGNGTISIGNADFSYSSFDASKLDAKLADSISGVEFSITGNNGTGDKIIASKLGGKIDGSGGASGAPDAITLNAGKDIVVFSDTTANNVTNITNFDTNADILKLGSTNFTGSSSASELTTAVKDSKLAADTIYVGTYANIASLKTT
ncbi:MAG: calcium-binding protein, partial [Rhodocyclaceae bacterium]